jgi:hypothetical protein
VPILSQPLKAETADREVRSTAYQLRTTRSMAARTVASSSLGRTAGESVDAPRPFAFG